ncbi:hypothetical protein CYMTET_35996 [Cymbomonas tetramitiformis]|uniref:Uncharacterized protein n=1 Tax=Cymbomonas tetramitiformis TaxID=36881 RepID=A0AAE0F843_9CHLO|nr:hypothetical protein CYMTET_35996 [Cymbomonas tetramitiformis]
MPAVNAWEGGYGGLAVVRLGYERWELLDVGLGQRATQWASAHRERDGFSWARAAQHSRSAFIDVALGGVTRTARCHAAVALWPRPRNPSPLKGSPVARGYVEALRVLPNALHAAAEKGAVEMVSGLMEKGVEVDAEDREGRTALTVALTEAVVDKILDELVEDAVQGAEEDRLLEDNFARLAFQDGEGRTALTVALAFGQEAVARALLEAGAGVNAGTGRRPFHAAAEKGMVEMVRELAGKGAEVDAEDGEGRTALTVALAFGQEAAARALLEAGAGVNAGTGQRPLHAAAMKGMEEMVRELVEKSTEVDAGGIFCLCLSVVAELAITQSVLAKCDNGLSVGTGVCTA